MRGAVLQALEFANHLAELLALFQVGDGAFEGFLADADEFAGDARAARVENGLDERRTGVDFTKHGIGVHLDIVERDARGVVRVDHDRAFDRHALGLGIDQQQRHAVLVIDAAGGACCDDQEVGDMAVDNEGLGARQGEAVA